MNKYNKTRARTSASNTYFFYFASMCFSFLKLLHNGRDKLWISIFKQTEYYLEFINVQFFGFVFCVCKHLMRHNKLINAVSTAGSKIIRTFEIIRVKKLIPNAVLWNKYLSNHDL